MMIFKSNIHRSRNDIITSILTSTTESIGKTRTMYMAFLSSAQTRGYLADLIEQGQLSYDVVSKTFAITDAGKKYLRLHNTMLRIGRRLDRL
jgi:predicted transcriptional regulator